MKTDLKLIEIQLISSDRQAVESVRTVFRNSGFSHIDVKATLDDLREALESPLTDLIVCDAWFPDGDPCRLVRSLRQHKFGFNPFLPVIMITRDPVPTLVKNVIDSGADSLMALPLSANQVIEKVNNLIHKRKPFVVSTDYVGPDRRKKPRAGSAHGPVLEVPNILKEKAMGSHDPMALQRQINSSIAVVNARKLECDAIEIGLVIDLLIKAYAGKSPVSDAGHYIDRLITATRDMDRRLADTAQEHLSESCNTLHETAKRIRDNITVPTEEDLKHLLPLSNAIQGAFGVEEEVARQANAPAEPVPDTVENGG